jgi:hypothetical protein
MITSGLTLASLRKAFWLVQSIKHREAKDLADNFGYRLRLTPGDTGLEFRSTSKENDD